MIRKERKQQKRDKSELHAVNMTENYPSVTFKRYHIESSDGKSNIEIAIKATAKRHQESKAELNR